VGEVTKRLAMLPASEREVQLEKEIAALRERLQHREVESLDLDAYLHVEDYQPGPPPPVTLSQLEDLLTHAQATSHLFQTHPEIVGAYLLNWRGEQLPVTFSPTCFDEYPTTVRFLSYGSPLLTEVLNGLPSPEEKSLDITGLARCAASGDLDLRNWYVRPQPGTHVAPIASLASLIDHLKARAQADASDSSLLAEAQSRFALELAQTAERQLNIIRRQRTAHYLAVRAKAQLLLLRAALVELALGQSLNLLDDVVYPSEFNEQAVSGLQRHGFPWGALLKLAFTPGLAPNADDPYFRQITGEKRESLLGRFMQLREEAKKAVASLQAAYVAARTSTQYPLQPVVQV